MKRLRWMIVAFVVALLAASCSGGEEAPDPVASPTDEGTAAEQPTDEETAAEEPAEDAEWQAIVEAAKEEGQLTWYSVAPQASRDGLQAAFAEAYPEIELEIAVLPIAETETALETERDTGASGGDIVTSVNYAWALERAEEGWWAEFAGPNVAEDWAGTEYVVDNQILQAPLGLIVLGWNTDLYSEGLETYEDLLNPSLAGGAIGMARAEPAIHADYWAFLEDAMGEDFLADFAGQEPILYPSAFALQEALAAGEVAVGGFVSATDMVQLQENDAPVDFAVPDPAWTATNWFYIPDWAENSNAAQVFLNFVASPEGQLAAAEYGFSPLESVAPQTLGADSEVVLTNVDRMLEEGWYEDFLARWMDLYEN